MMKTRKKTRTEKRIKRMPIRREELVSLWLVPPQWLSFVVGLVAVVADGECNKTTRDVKARRMKYAAMK